MPVTFAWIITASSYRTLLSLSPLSSHCSNLQNNWRVRSDHLRPSSTPGKQMIQFYREVHYTDLSCQFLLFRPAIVNQLLGSWYWLCACCPIRVRTNNCSDEPNDSVAFVRLRTQFSALCFADAEKLWQYIQTAVATQRAKVLLNTLNVLWCSSSLPHWLFLTGNSAAFSFCLVVLAERCKWVDKHSHQSQARYIRQFELKNAFVLIRDSPVVSKICCTWSRVSNTLGSPFSAFC